MWCIINLLQPKWQYIHPSLFTVVNFQDLETVLGAYPLMRCLPIATLTCGRCYSTRTFLVHQVEGLLASIRGCWQPSVINLGSVSSPLCVWGSAEYTTTRIEQAAAYIVQITQYPRGSVRILHIKTPTNSTTSTLQYHLPHSERSSRTTKHPFNNITTPDSEHGGWTYYTQRHSTRGLHQWAPPPIWTHTHTRNQGQSKPPPPQTQHI